MGLRFSKRLLSRCRPRKRENLDGISDTQLRKKLKKGAQSNREREFIVRWAENGGQKLIAQYQFHPTRKWQFDWCHIEARVAIEIHGGIWIGGRHVRGNGFRQDRIRQNAALRLNWKVFELTPEDINKEVMAEIMDEISRRLKETIDIRDGLLPFANVFVDNKARRKKKAA